MTPETQDYLNRVSNGMIKVAEMVRQDTNDALKADHVTVIKHFAAVRAAVETIKTARKALEEIEDNLSKNQIPDIVRALKEKTGEKPPFNIEGVGRVTVANRYSCSMIDKAAGFDWLRGNGHGGLITETVNSSSLSSFAKEYLEDKGMELPDDIFKVGTQSYTSITKAK